MSARCMATPLNANAAAGHTMWTRASETIGHQGMYNGNILTLTQLAGRGL